MSEASKSPKKKASDRKRKAGQDATALPDDAAIRKLFPRKVVDKVNKEIDRRPRKK